MKHIRNFSIIAHIDHGKSTLADRFIEFAVAWINAKWIGRYWIRWISRKSDGITIKAQTAALNYKQRWNYL